MLKTIKFLIYGHSTKMNTKQRFQMLLCNSEFAPLHFFKFRASDTMIFQQFSSVDC